MLKLLFPVLVISCVPSVSAQNVIDVCDCDPIGSLSRDCDTDRQCECKPGVGGLQCEQCLPGHTGFGENGCMPLTDCQCHPTGSLSDECDERGRCLCHLGIDGDKCDTCQNGFHRIDLGCIPCPTCFNEVAVQFNLTLELYTNLLQRLNDTLSNPSDTGGGLNPDLSEEITRYRSLLTNLLQRVLNATAREGDLTAELVDFQSVVDTLRGRIDSSDANITMTEAMVASLTLQANRTQSALDNLLSLVSSLETRVITELRDQLDDVIALNRQLLNDFDVLVELATEADRVSLSQEARAAELLQQATVIVSNATTALELLQEAVAIQNQTRQFVEMVRNETLGRLESLYMEGVAALSDAETSVPTALENSTVILERVMTLFTPDYDLESHQERLALLRNATAGLFNSTALLNSNLNLLLANFSEYNDTAGRLISESQALNREAVELLTLAERAFSSANNSVIDGNEIIREARRLLREIQDRLSNGRDFTAGLEEVLRNIALAESLSLEAEEETSRRERELRDAIATTNRAATLLEGAIMTLSTAFEVATGANVTANRLLSTAGVLSSTATEFAGEVSQAGAEVDQLEEAVNDDTEAIAMVTNTALEAISAAANLTSRLIVIRDLLANLTAEFDSISLIPPERIQTINSTLSSLEEDSASNQRLVDSLTDQVRQLQESADELRARYVQVQQHRDLLQDILRNVEDLNCREQFEN